jgi:hypothetical protein
MIVVTRLKNGEIAHFQADCLKQEDARNEIRNGLAAAGQFYEDMPFLVVIPDCGRDVNKSVMAHRVPPTRKDPLQGAIDALNKELTSGTPPQSQELPDGGLLYVRSAIDNMLEFDE